MQCVDIAEGTGILCSVETLRREEADQHNYVVQVDWYSMQCGDIAEEADQYKYVVQEDWYIMQCGDIAEEADQYKYVVQTVRRGRRLGCSVDITEGGSRPV